MKDGWRKKERKNYIKTERKVGSSFGSAPQWSSARWLLCSTVPCQAGVQYVVVTINAHLLQLSLDQPLHKSASNLPCCCLWTGSDELQRVHEVPVVKITDTPAPD